MLKILFLILTTIFFSIILYKCISIKKYIAKEIIITLISLLEIILISFLFSTLLTKIISLSSVLLISIIISFTFFIKNKNYKASEFIDLIAIYISSFVVISIAILI